MNLIKCPMAVLTIHSPIIMLLVASIAKEVPIATEVCLCLFT